MSPSLSRRLASLHVVGDVVLLLALCASIEWRLAPAPLPTLASRCLLTVTVLLVCLRFQEVFRVGTQRSLTRLFVQVGRAAGVALLVLALAHYAAPELTLGLPALAAFLVLSAGAVFVWHATSRWLADMEELSENILVLGTGLLAQQLAAEIVRREPLGFRLVGFLGEDRSEIGRRGLQGPILGTADDLAEVVERHRVNLIVVAQEDRRGRLPVDELLRCRGEGITVEDAPNFYERLTGEVLVSDLRPSWLIFSPGFRRSLRVRRFVDTALAAVLLVLCGPLIGLLVLLVRWDSPGPAIYRQPRVGRNGRVFDLLKLRTMRLDAESGGPMWATPGRDPRVTRLGHWLRKLRLDELPQFVNVLRGEMSFVGPRPERPHFVEQLRKVIPFYNERLNVLPGITGWAQVKFGYGSTIEDSERKLQYDLYYIKNMSPFLDAAIILDTIKVMAVGRGAR